MKALNFVLSFGPFPSREKAGNASNSEVRRWFQNKAIICNGEALEFQEEMDFPIISFVLFPKSFNRITLW